MSFRARRVVSKALGKGLEHAFQMIAPRQAMFASEPVMGAAEFLVIPDARKTPRLGAELDSPRKHAGEKQGLVADVRAQLKAGPVIRGLQRRDHFKKIVERSGPAGNNALRAGRFGKGDQHFRHVVGQRAVIQVRAFECVADEHVKIEAAGYPQAAAAFEQGAKKGFIVQNQIPRILVGQELDEAVGGAELAAEDFEDELDILRRKLHPTIRLNDLHRFLSLR